MILLTIRENIWPSLSQIHCVGVDAIVHCRAETGPVYPYGPALEQIGEEEGNGPDEDDGDHCPHRWFDEGPFEDPGGTY